MAVATSPMRMIESYGLTLYCGARFTVGFMDVTLLYFQGCPNWELADAHLQTLAAERGDLVVTRRLVETAAEAERVGFLGSPSIQVDGGDVFAGPGAQVGRTCRRYVTPDGVAGAPTVDQLRAVLTGA